MTGEFIGLVAVILTLGIPLAALYTYYRVRKLRTEERLAALARGAEIPMEPELSQYAKSRRAGILLVSAGIGFILMFAMIARAVTSISIVRRVSNSSNIPISVSDRCGA